MKSTKIWAIVLLALGLQGTPLFADESHSIVEENKRLKERIAQLEIENAQLKEKLPQVAKPYAKESIWQKKSKAERGFLDFNVYYDFEKFSVFTLNAGAKLPSNFSYFSLTNYSNDLDADDPLRDHDSFYTEQNLLWQLPGDLPFQLTLQWNMISGRKNDKLRFGIKWAAHDSIFLSRILDTINTKYWINFHAFQLDFINGYQWQIEHVYHVNVLPKLLDERVYLAGFADHSIGEGSFAKWVTEHQLGVRIIDNLYGVLEYRYNGNRSEDDATLGIGVQYIVNI